VSSVLRFPFSGAGRSLSGTPLNGDRGVRLVYIDEAGISNPSQEPWLVVAGVIVDADKQLIHLERKIRSIIDRHIPEQFRDGFIFHAKELFNGGGAVFKRHNSEWPLKKRLEIAMEIAALPRKIGLPIVIGAIERKTFDQTFNQSEWNGRSVTEAAHAVAFSVCSVHTELWMRRKASSEICMLIVEDNSSMRTFLTNIQHAHQDPKYCSVHVSETKILPYRKIRASPLFEKKQDSVSLQMADFCAYVMKKASMTDPRYYDLFKMLEPQIVQEADPDIERTTLAG
jgi:hypothetical protein